MYKRPALGIREHKALKEYCNKHDLTMLEVLNGLVDYIVVNDVSPSLFIDSDSDELFSNREYIISRLLLEIEKNRNTYVSFQRTFEKQYERDMTLLKEMMFYNTRKIIAGIVKNSAYEDTLKEAVGLFSVIMIEEMITEYAVSKETAVEIVESYIQALMQGDNIFVTQLEEVSKEIAERIGVGPDDSKHKTNLKSQKKAMYKKGAERFETKKKKE